MEFRAPSIATQQNATTTEYLIQNLDDPEAGRNLVDQLISELGNATDSYPDWHPILTLPSGEKCGEHVAYLSQIDAYAGIDHTREFVKGFVTCPYSEDAANKIVKASNKIMGIHSYRLEQCLYAEGTYPVVVEAVDVELEADGTIRSRDALRWFAQQAIKEAWDAQVAETWWNIRHFILGQPHGSRSSLFVNQHTGVHMRKILEALNNSGMFGPIKESSLDMLSQSKRDKISETLIRTAVDTWNGSDKEFEFELRGENCKAELRDTWDDGHELSIRVRVGKQDLYATGFYYKKDNSITHADPQGKRAIAEKFL